MQVKAAIDQIVFQLTAPHGGRQGSGSNDCRPEGISTHGPTRGPTKLAYSIEGMVKISTHGPTRGPTRRPWTVLVLALNFNSRPHTGADTWWLIYAIWTRSFQLTAPHGGRPSAPCPDPRISHFNSRPHTGADVLPLSTCTLPTVFQLTAPHGGRPERGRTDSLTGYFNSRPHTGADARVYGDSDYATVFQLTAPHGGRLIYIVSLP